MSHFKLKANQSSKAPTKSSKKQSSKKSRKDNTRIKHYTEEQKEAILNQLEGPEELSIAALAKKEGMSDKTIYRWLAAKKKDAKKKTPTAKISKKTVAKKAVKSKASVKLKIETKKATTKKSSKATRPKAYTEDVKEAILKQLKPPHNRTIREVAEKEGIGKSTIHEWKKKSKMSAVKTQVVKKAAPKKFEKVKPKPEVKPKPSKKIVGDRSTWGRFVTVWDGQEVFLKDCKKIGTSSGHIDQFIDKMQKAIQNIVEEKSTSEVKSLKAELKRKTEALAEAAARFVLKEDGK